MLQAFDPAAFSVCPDPAAAGQDSTIIYLLNDKLEVSDVNKLYLQIDKKKDQHRLPDDDNGNTQKISIQINHCFWMIKADLLQHPPMLPLSDLRMVVISREGKLKTTLTFGIE